MEVPGPAIDIILEEYYKNPHPVVFGRVPGEYSISELSAMEAELQERLHVKRVTLGRSAGELLYMIDNSVDGPEVSAA